MVKRNYETLYFLLGFDCGFDFGSKTGAQADVKQMADDSLISLTTLLTVDGDSSFGLWDKVENSSETKTIEPKTDENG